MQPENQLQINDGNADGEYAFRTRTSRWAVMDGGANAVMMFVDYLQVPFNGDIVCTAFFESGEEVVVDTSIQLPEATGDHHVFGMVIYDPYRNLENGRFELLDASHQKLVINVN